MKLPMWYVREIEPGMTGLDVDVVRRKLGLLPGPHDLASQSRIRGLARKNNVKSNGEVNEDVANVLGESAANAADLVPEWFVRDIKPGAEPGEDVRQLRGRLALSVGSLEHTYEVEDAVRRYQSQHGLPCNGIVDERMAKLLG